jgi:hypothetical protein
MLTIVIRRYKQRNKKAQISLGSGRRSDTSTCSEDDRRFWRAAKRDLRPSFEHFMLV